MITKKRASGFTLVEIVVALSILTLISAFLLNALGPWLNFKQKIDNDRKLMEVKTIFTTIYERNAWSVETNAGAVFTFSGGVLNNSPMNGSICVSQMAVLTGLSQYFSDGLPAGEQDGYGSPFCFLISPQLSQNMNGSTLYYHNIAVVSMGRDGKKNAGTVLDATGALTLAGDDSGVLVNGFSVQSRKYVETAARLDRVAKAYEQYFTTRFLANPGRDVYIDYFADSNPTGNWDGTVAGASVTGTQGAFQDIFGHLGALGISPEDARSAWESNNTMYVGNYDETVPGTTVKVRSSAGGVAPPYTAVLYAELPGPAGTNLIKTVMGTY